jgi:tRNA (cmo5U34)-methyltransferase
MQSDPYLERYGHDWRSPERVREYVQRVDREIDRRADGLAVLLQVIPFEPDRAISVLDIGCGPGLVAARVLDAFPQARAVGLDVSEPMREVAGERMASYGGRFGFVLADFVEGELPAEARGPFDLVVSSRAIHHIPAEHKQRLYRTVFSALNPGGGFFNLDRVGPAEARLPGHYYDTLEQHLGFLRQAGFTRVDCFWKRLSLALLGGYRA